MVGSRLEEGAPDGPAGEERGVGQRWAKETKLGREQAKRERGAYFPFIYLFLLFFYLSFVSILSNHIYTQKELKIK
jgi:hypothetical protein